jgi:hypothetical protein
MPTWAYVIVVVAVVAAILVAAAVALATRRSKRLRSTFSSEYDRAVEESGGKRRAEQELLEREKQRDRLVIRPLAPAARERYAERWRRTQAEFVDTPEASVRDANALVEEVMTERGYPVSSFEEQAAVVSVDHADVVQGYRSAHEISLAAAAGEATTEDLRRAMRQYRTLFEELLGATTDGTETQTERDREFEEVRR